MTKRLQVRRDDAELEDIQRIARGKHMTTAERARQSLRTARASDSVPAPGRKLELVAAAVVHSFPTGDIDALLRDIEPGYVENDS